ncbi:hypothetical protein, partial [Clostridium perfringens]|uniref:hypothetical protein n=1 Tax=Clostridium perfringens TaxID=1502 RepID=UPI001A7E7C82
DPSALFRDSGINALIVLNNRNPLESIWLRESCCDEIHDELVNVRAGARDVACTAVAAWGTGDLGATYAAPVQP